jgi:quercetin dioxygenase-like cupin family protein
MHDADPQIYFADTKSKAVFAADGPQPQFLIDTPGFKIVVVGLEAGSHIPAHPDQAAMYHVLEGNGLMTIGEDVFEIKPGVTVIVPSGVKRGINARTRLIFLGSKGES